MDKKQVSILGTSYEIETVKYDEDNFDVSGMCDSSQKIIKILDFDDYYDHKKPMSYIVHRYNHTLRHEILHAFLAESGLDSQACGGTWAINEEMIDWFALQSPKIFKVYQELGIVDNFNAKEKSNPDKKYVTILGTSYEIETVKYDEDNFDVSGMCDSSQKIIKILDFDDYYDHKKPMSTIIKLSNETLRHEILHGFLSESGLDSKTCRVGAWALNEEIVDWFALQSPKIFKAYQELGIVDNYDY